MTLENERAVCHDFANTIPGNSMRPPRGFGRDVRTYVTDIPTDGPTNEQAPLKALKTILRRVLRMKSHPSCSGQRRQTRCSAAPLGFFQADRQLLTRARRRFRFVFRDHGDASSRVHAEESTGVRVGAVGEKTRSRPSAGTRWKHTPSFSRHSW